MERHLARRSVLVDPALKHPGCGSRTDDGSAQLREQKETHDHHALTKQTSPKRRALGHTTKHLLYREIGQHSPQSQTQNKKKCYTAPSARTPGVMSQRPR